MAYTETINQRTDSQQLMKELMGKYLRPDMDLYDIGCGTKPFADFLHGRVSRHIGIDIDHGFYAREHIDLIGSAVDLPVGDNAADALLSSQVIEHLPDPIPSFKEAYRALKPGGYLFLSYPFLYPIHAVPHDYMRLTRYATEDALRDAGFQLIEFKTLGGFWYLVGVIMPIYLAGVAPLQKLKLGKPLAWMIRGTCSLLHRLEGYVATTRGSDIEAARASWAVTYVLVAQKPLRPQ